MVEISYALHMVEILANWIISAFVIVIAAYLLPGVHVVDFTTALWTALVLGVVNAILKPILIILTLPINILTLGLFTFIINAFLILIVGNGKIVHGFTVESFWWALLFSLLLSILRNILNLLFKK